MANYPMNIWVIDENEFDEFTFTGGKVIYIAEEMNPMYKTHPSIVSAGALLPPVEAIQAELDGRMFETVSVYNKYLESQEADQYISIIIAAAIQQSPIPIGIMFGKDEMELTFPKMFIDFLYGHYGLVLGLKGKLQPYIEEEFVPFDLAKLYVMNIINYEEFMVKHPPLPINGLAISKMACEQNPPVKVKDFNHYLEYFESVKDQILRSGRRFLIEPMEGV